MNGELRVVGFVMVFIQIIFFISVLGEVRDYLKEIHMDLVHIEADNAERGCR